MSSSILFLLSVYSSHPHICSFPSNSWRCKWLFLLLFLSFTFFYFHFSSFSPLLSHCHLYHNIMIMIIIVVMMTQDGNMREAHTHSPSSRCIREADWENWWKKMLAFIVIFTCTYIYISSCTGEKRQGLLVPGTKWGVRERIVWNMSEFAASSSSSRRKGKE